MSYETSINHTIPLDLTHSVKKKVTYKQLITASLLLFEIDCQPNKLHTRVKRME